MTVSDDLQHTEWLTVNEAASYLKVSRQTIYLYCRSGLLAFYELKSGRGRRFQRSDLDNLLERQPSQPVHPMEG
jgi:excisionase family DNA binding protein